MGPPLDPRRTVDFAAELRQRARSWIPSWELTDGEHDFGRALLDIAARFNSEVAERLDRGADKMQRGFLDWLAVRGEAARPARMPVVFKLADTARVGVAAPKPVRLQADADGTAVAFETETDVRVVPGRLETLVGVDAGADAFYLPPPGLSDLQPLETLPSEWQVKSFASVGATKLQLDPEAGLVVGMILSINGQHYKIVAVDKDLITINPPLATELAVATPVPKVTTFTPFGGEARNWQAHAVYLGDPDLLNIEADATIAVVGASALNAGITWSYWGKQAAKQDSNDTVDWQTLKAADIQDVPGALVLTKPKGAIELRDIDGKNGRWIRAYAKTVGATAEPFTTDAFSIRINPIGCKDEGPACPPPDEETPSPSAEAMANTTPLVLDKAFFPLGREPRQFDAFYLGSQEVFSKKGAKVHLCFEMAEPNFAVLAALKTSQLGNQFLGGVAADGHLHLFSLDATTGRLSRYNNRDPLLPTSVALDRKPTFRPAIWRQGSDIFVAVSAKQAVWAWRENGTDPANSGWVALGNVDPVADPATPIEGIAYLAAGAGGYLLALRESTLFIRDLSNTSASWEVVETKNDQGVVVTRPLTQIAPIYLESQALTTSFTDGAITVDANHDLFGIKFTVDAVTNTISGQYSKRLLDDVLPTVAPVALRRMDQRLVAVAVSDDAKPKLLGFLSKPANPFDPEDTDDVELDWPPASPNTQRIIGNSIDANITAGQLTVVVSIGGDADKTALAAWTPFDATHPTRLFSSVIPNQAGIASAAPTLLPQHVVVPSSGSQVIVARFDPAQRLSIVENLLTAVVTSDVADQLVANDNLAIPIDGGGGATKYQLETITTAGTTYRGRTFHQFNIESINKNFFVYRDSTAPFSGDVDAAALNTLKIAANDNTTGNGSILLIETDASTELYAVNGLNAMTRVATLDRDLNVSDPMNPPATVNYRAPDSTQAKMVPLLELDPASSGNWDASVLDRTRLFFRNAKPEFQEGTAFKVTGDGRAELVALGEHWIVAPPPAGPGLFVFVVDAAVGEWAAQLGDVSSNPELSWEYWNGKGWWGLDVSRDGTLNLKKTGKVQFAIPDDIASSDWAGKTNFWIRARLIGGDYGKEKVTVTTKDLGGGKSEQTVERSLEGIRPPSVVRLQISYGLCNDSKPVFVLTEDSGSTRDQSDANRTPGAIVEAFVPLAVTLARLSGKATTSQSVHDCPPECGCHGATSATKSADRLKKTDDTSDLVCPEDAVAPGASGRALLIGLTAPPSEETVRVLLLVKEEQKYDRFAPLGVAALVADQFVPIVADDATRGLGESGLLSMAFPIPPTPRDLFGGKSLSWLRLTPPAGDVAAWKPALRGAYLNAVWASATETLTRELVGSSDGAPNLTLTLQRPPVLRNTLELRVREPLGEEEREQLRSADPQKVVTNVEGLSGDWVRWTQVIDPNDEPPLERVYALDESIGEIRFGDGTHGAIPPIGRDSIVAFSYQRTETGPPGTITVPGNTIAARTALNLVSPVESVEAVVAADQAAGGAPAESGDRVVRFGLARLRHRNRAVSPRDIEDLALQSSPDIVQAGAFLQRGGMVRLIVVMRGKDPRPTAAQVRELRRLLLAAAPPALSAPAALQIAGPRVRRLVVQLKLRVETLDYAGALARLVKERIARFFDTDIGGSEKSGWLLGTSPSAEDVAFALIDVARLDGIADVVLFEIDPDGTERRWTGTAKPTDLIVLADNPVRIQFETAEVLA